jgi:hypothetical protein
MEEERALEEVEKPPAAPSLQVSQQNKAGNTEGLGPLLAWCPGSKAVS